MRVRSCLAMFLPDSYTLFFLQIWVKVSSMFVRWRRTNCLLRAQSWLHSEGGAEVGQVRGQGLSLHYAIGRLPGNNATGKCVWKSVWEEVTCGFYFLLSLCSIVFEQLSRFSKVLLTSPSLHLIPKFVLRLPAESQSQRPSCTCIHVWICITIILCRGVPTSLLFEWWQRCCDSKPHCIHTDWQDLCLLTDSPAAS